MNDVYFHEDDYCQRSQLLCAVIVSSLSIPIVWTGCNVAFQYASGYVSSLIIIPHTLLSFAHAFVTPYPLCLSAAFVAVTICRFLLSSRDKHIALRPVFLVATSGIIAAVTSMSFTLLLQWFVGFGTLGFAMDLFIVFRDSVSISTASAVVCFTVYCSHLKHALRDNPHPAD